MVARHELVERVDALERRVAMAGVFDFLRRPEDAQLPWSEQARSWVNVGDREGHIAAG